MEHPVPNPLPVWRDRQRGLQTKESMHLASWDEHDRKLLPLNRSPVLPGHLRLHGWAQTRENLRCSGTATLQVPDGHGDCGCYIGPSTRRAARSQGKVALHDAPSLGLRYTQLIYVSVSPPPQRDAPDFVPSSIGPALARTQLLSVQVCSRNEYNLSRTTSAR